MAAPDLDDPVPSPCVQVCKLDMATRLCVGCRRHIDEIRVWTKMTSAEKRAVWARLDERSIPTASRPPS